MDKEKISNFTRRISQANHSELVVITLEIEIEYLKDAKLEFEKNNIDVFLSNLKKTQKFHLELMSSLKLDNTVSLDVYSLYLFVNKAIIQSIIKKQPIDLDASIKILSNLLVGFDGMAKKDLEPPIMKNTQQVYAGLTYGRGYLNETYVDPLQINRGFKA